MRGFAENIAANTAESSHAADMAVADWLTSPGHRRSMEGAYDFTGIGVAQGPTGAYFFTQLFVRTPSFRPGTAESDSTDKSSAPAPRAARIEQQIVENPLIPYLQRIHTGNRVTKKIHVNARDEKETAQGWVQELD